MFDVAIPLEVEFLLGILAAVSQVQDLHHEKTMHRSSWALSLWHHWHPWSSGIMNICDACVSCLISAAGLYDSTNSAIIP